MSNAIVPIMKYNFIAMEIFLNDIRGCGALTRTPEKLRALFMAGLLRW